MAKQQTLAQRRRAARLQHAHAACWAAQAVHGLPSRVVERGSASGPQSRWRAFPAAVLAPVVALEQRERAFEIACERLGAELAPAIARNIRGYVYSAVSIEPARILATLREQRAAASHVAEPAPLAQRLEAYRAHHAVAARFASGVGARDVAERAVARLSADVLASGVMCAVREAYLECAFRRANGAWAGGNHTVVVRLGEPNALSSTDRVWSSNGKWSGLDSSHTVVVRATWRADVEARGLAVVSGMLTLGADELPCRSGEDAYAATWVRQGAGTALVVERGVLYRRDGGEWVHGATLAGARATAARRAVPAPEAAARQSAQAAARASRFRAALETVAALCCADFLAAYGSETITLTRATAEAAGNCYSGSLAWCESYADGRTSGTIRECLDAAERCESAELRARARAACNVAAARAALRRSRAAA